MRISRAGLWSAWTASAKGMHRVNVKGLKRRRGIADEK